MSSTREQFIETTCELMETQGYHGTGLNQIIRESGAPKGSLYYYFPGGKEELTSEAIQWTGHVIVERIQTSLDQIADPAEAVRQFILTLARHVAASEFRAGGPITSIALESATTSERLNEACREVYGLWQAAFEQRLLKHQYPPERAVRLAALIIASIEGAIVLSRTDHTIVPLERVAEELACLLRAAKRECE